MKLISALLAIAIIASSIVAGETPRVKIGESLRLGGLEITPSDVTVRRIKIGAPGWPSSKMMDSEKIYTVLSLKIVNVTDVQAIEPGEITGLMEDQYGNAHKNIKAGMICKDCKLLEKTSCSELLPNDTQSIVAIFEAPKIKKAELFSINLIMNIDNRGTPGSMQVAFDRSIMKNNY